MKQAIITKEDRVEMGVPPIGESALPSRPKMDVMASNSRFWFTCGVSLGVVSQLAGIGMAFIVIDENSSYTTCGTLFITVNVHFALLEYFLF